MATALKHISELSADFLRLFFPENCAACGRVLQSNEKEICLICHSDLPLTHFWKHPANPMEQLFWGRVKIEKAFALFYYKKGNQVQQLIHNIKYRGNLTAGEYCGKWLGDYIQKSTYAEPIDLVIPVPLHPKRYRKRGFNQCDCIAKGVSVALNCGMEKNQIKRIKYNISQTRKDRFERWKNVDKIFTVNNPEALRGKHVLIVDDVITTGSTLEACLHAFSDIEDVKVSVAVLGFSSQ